jgi:membrane protein YqaA with SNARE-associated domain
VTSAIAFPALMDPMYWLGNGGVFGSAVLVGVMIIIFIETGLLFPFLPGDTLLFTAGMIAAQATTPVGIWALTPCTAVAAVLGAQCAFVIGRRVGPAVFGKDDSRFFKTRYLMTSHEFFERHGPKILVIALHRRRAHLYAGRRRGVDNGCIRCFSRSASSAASRGLSVSHWSVTGSA